MYRIENDITKGARAVYRLSHYLTARMNQLGVSAADVASKSKVPKQTVSNLLNGKIKEPDLRTLAPVARALDLNLAQLIEVVGYSVGDVVDDEETQRIARLIRQVPWLTVGVERMLDLPPDELQLLLDYMEHRVAERLKAQG